VPRATPVSPDYLSSGFNGLRAFRAAPGRVGTKRAPSLASDSESDSAHSGGLCMDWRHKRVHFRIRDVYLPDAGKLVMQLRGDDLLQGTVVAVTQGEGAGACYAMIKVPGIEDKLIVPLEMIKGDTWNSFQ